MCCPCCHLAPPPTQTLLIQHAHTLHRFTSASICCVMPTQPCANLCDTRLGDLSESCWEGNTGLMRCVLPASCFALHRNCFLWVPAALRAGCRRMLPFMRVCSWQPLWVECSLLVSHLMVASMCCTTWLGPPMPGRGAYPTPPGVCAHLQNLARPPSKVCFARVIIAPKAMPCDFFMLVCTSQFCPIRLIIKICF